ncbi:MAG: heparin lyase I family protein [Myxococcota bacterium]
MTSRTTLMMMLCAFSALHCADGDDDVARPAWGTGGGAGTGPSDVSLDAEAPDQSVWPGPGDGEAVQAESGPPDDSAGDAAGGSTGMKADTGAPDGASGDSGAGASTGELLFVGDRETQDPSPWTHVLFNDIDERFALVDTPVRQGARAAMFKVRPGDKYRTFSGERAEVSIEGRDDLFESDGETSFYGWSTYFPTDWTGPEGWAIFCQWHACGCMGQWLVLEDVPPVWILSRKGQRHGQRRLPIRARFPCARC